MRTSDPECDVYVFYNGKHYETQVRYKETNPEYAGQIDLKSLTGKDREYITEELNKGFREFDNPHCGEHFMHDSAQECLDNLLILQEDGVKLSLSGIAQLRSVAEREHKA